MKMDDLMDDDFGDIYADVEVKASSAINSISNFDKLYVEPREEEEEEEEQECNYNNNAKQVSAEPNAENLWSDMKPLNAVCEKSCNSEEYGSDSEDDLHIVLNEEDCKSFSVAAERNRNGNGIEEDEGLNLNANGHELNDSNNSHYQHKHGPLFPNSNKVNESVGVASRSKSARGDWEDNRCNLHEISNTGQLASLRAETNSVVSYGGHGFSLPWYRNILDVNIEAFEEKRWRYPGADISDFFNFGFNEDSWKQYCISLEQLRQHSYMQSRFPNHEFSKLTQAFEIRHEWERAAEDIAQAGSSSKFADMGLPKGRAIQVEDGTGERQPTMDLRRPHVWYSDVVIQINVQDSDENSSGSGNREICHIETNEVEASKIKDFNVNGRKDGHDSGSSSTEESLEERSSSMDRFPLPTSESSQIALDPDDHDQDHKVNAETLEDTAEAMEPVQKTEENGRGNCNSDQCLTETELSDGDRSHFSLTLSCSENDSEASENSVHSMPKVSPRFLSRQSSGTVLLEQDAADFKSPKSKIAIRKPDNSQHCSRRRRPIWEGRRNQNSRLHRVSERRIHSDTTSDASPMSRYQLSFDDYRQTERAQDFGYHDRENFSCDLQREYSGNDGEKFAEKRHFQDLHTKHPQKRYHSFRHEVEHRRIWIEENFYERSIRLDDQDDVIRNWDSGGRNVSPRSMIPPTCQSSRRLISKYNDFYETDIQWRRKNSKIERVKQINDDVCFLDRKNMDHGMPHKCRRSILFNMKRKSCENIPFAGRKACGRRVRYGYSPPMNLDDPWCMETKDEHWDLDYQHLSYWPDRESYAANKGRWKNKMSPRCDTFDPRLAERYGGHGRELTRDTYRDSDWVENYYDVDDAEDAVVYTDDWAHRGRRKYSWQSQEMHCMEDESTLRQQDNEYYAKRSSSPYEKSSRHESFRSKYRSANDCTLVDDVQLKWHRYKMSEGENSASFLDRKSDVICRGEHERRVRWCNDPSDLIFGEGKSLGRCSNSASLVANGKFETVDQKVSKDFHGTQSRKARQRGSSKLEGSKDDEKWKHKFPVREQNEDLDIEEGQIVPQEPADEDRLEKKHASESMAAIQNMKKRVHNGNVSTGNEIDKGYDEQQILDTLAKLERRRQRFKNPIALKREPDLTAKPQIELIADMVANKRERPSRKRRWSGS